MATLEQIRERKKLLIGAILFALLAFVVGDAIQNIPSIRSGKNDVGSVEGKTMSAPNFQKQVSVMSNIFQASGQNLKEGEVRDAAWNSFIQSEVLNNESEATGLSVTPSELKEATLGDNPHPMMRQIPLFYNQNQQFDPSILYQVLAKIEEEEEQGIVDEEGKSLKSYWLFWEKRIQEQILTDKLNKLVASAMSAPKAEINFLKEIYKNEKKVALVSKQYSTLADSTFVPSEADLKKKYEEKKENFKTEKFRDVKCVAFNITATELDFEETAEKINATAEDFKTIGENELPYFVSQESDPNYPFNGFYRTESEIDPIFKDFAFSAKKDSVAPVVLDGTTYKTARVLSNVINRADSVNVNAIAVGGTSIEDATNRADSLIAVIKAGADFKEIAQKHSADPNGRQTGGEWGWLREGLSGSAEFDSIVFSAKVGDVVKVSTPQAVLVVKVNQKTAPVKKVRVAIIANKVVPGKKTEEEAFDKANNFISINNTKEKFMKAAEEGNYIVRPLGPITENQHDLIVVSDGRQIVKWAFDAELNEVCPKPFRVVDNTGVSMYIATVLTDVVENGYWDELSGNPLYIPFSNEIAQNQLKRAVIKDMKAEKLEAEIDPAGDLTAIGKIDTVTVSMNMISIPNVGREPALIAKIAQSKDNQVGEIKGDRGVYAFRVLSTSESPAAEVNAENVKENVRRYVYSHLVGTMMEEAEVEDNRSFFF